MHSASSIISKVAKAKQYSDEPDRIQFQDFTVQVRGDNSTHTVSFQNCVWSCTCNTYQEDNFCAHTMAVERVLGVTIPNECRIGEPFSQSGIHHTGLM